MTNKVYRSLGQMVKEGNFDKLLETLKESKDDERYINSLLSKKDGYSELENLLYFIPQYSLDENKKLKEKVLDVVDYIIALGTDANTIFKSGITVFMQACQYSNKELLEHLMKVADINLDQGDGRGARPLFYAVMGENVDVIEFLVTEKNANMNQKMILLEGKTVFHTACMEMKEKSILKLMELGARPDIYDDYENLPCELIPTFDEEIYSEEDKDEEFFAKCDQVFEITQAYYKEYKQEKQKKKTI
jgi:hypothetical protein